MTSGDRFSIKEFDLPNDLQELKKISNGLQKLTPIYLSNLMSYDVLTLDLSL
jgi:hypothetical protein